VSDAEVVVEMAAEREAQGKLQPMMRALNAWSFASGAREIAQNATRRSEGAAGGSTR
jgi:hypothetical protein